MAEATRKSVGPRFEPGCWSSFPCRHPSEQWIPGIITALATPAHTELPAIKSYKTAYCDLALTFDNIQLTEVDTAKMSSAVDSFMLRMLLLSTRCVAYNSDAPFT